jgi:hypothetical protein
MYSEVVLSMSKAMTIVGMIIAGLIGLAFTSDLLLGMPFGGTSDRPMGLMMDLASIISAAILGYLSWSAMRDIR